MEGTIYALRNILQHLAVDLAVIGYRRLDVGKFGFLLIVADRDTALLPGFPALVHSGIVDMTTQHEGTLKRPLLLGRGLEFVLEGLA